MGYSRKYKKKIFQAVVVVLLLIVAIIGSLQVGQVKELFSQAAYNPANFYIDAQAIIGNMPRPWRNLAQGGEDHAWRLQPLAKQVSALYPKYIRLDHIYDFYDVVTGSPGNLSLDFSKLDLVLADIRAVGATPFIALSYMPPAISQGSVLDQPVNYADWQYLVQKTIEHISGNQGFDNVYYEVWNEPDLFGSWKYYGEKNYLNLYAAAAQGANQAKNVRSFKLGGPATTALYKNWVESLMQFTTDNQLRLDFISWHQYTNDLDQYKRDMTDARNFAASFPKYDGVIEYLITEWGHDSNNNSGYDSKYSAAHTVAGAINMVGVVDHAFVFEIQDGKDPNGQSNWGRWGLFTATAYGAQAKPRYFGLKMLDSIADQRLQILGQGSMVKGLAAKNDDGNIQVVIANFDPKGINREAVPITYQNINPGNYLVKTRYLSGKTTTIKTTTEITELQTIVAMPPNDVALVELLLQP